MTNKQKIIIAGGTGFTGPYPAGKFIKHGAEVLIISRQPGHAQWTDHHAVISALEDADMLINLEGRSVDCRYTEKNKADIMRSRVDTTNILGKAILACKNPPALWINSVCRFYLSFPSN